MTVDDQTKHDNVRECYICHRKFTEKNGKVRDHDHISGKYRGAAHRTCNLFMRKQYKVPVFFHNFRGYDSHLLVWGLTEDSTSKLSIIGQGLEKYLMIGWGDHIEFKDSLQFIPASLERIIENLKSVTEDKFKN